MNPGLIGLTGGIVGGIIGVAGGLLGTYFSIKNTNGPRERAFVIKASIACWIFVLTFVSGMCLIPGLYKLLLIPVYVVGLMAGILLWNKQQAQIRLEESKTNPAPPAAPSTRAISRKLAAGSGALILICLAVLLAKARASGGDEGGGALILIYLAVLVIVSIIVIQIKRAAEPGIFGFIFDKLREKKNPAPPVAPSTQIIPRKCPQCGAELKPNVSEGLCPACLLQRGIATEGGAPPGTPPFTPPTIPDLAKLFPQLEILELIGKGGMGAVYKARQPALDRFVALKILAPRSGGDLDFAERFTREARALAKLSHPNIVAVHDFGTVGQASSLSPSEISSGKSETGKMPVLHYFIMEHVDGPNLRQIEQAGRLSPHEALEIIPQICAALQFAHDEGIVHRDIKPENVLLDKKGRVKIADFGLAKILGQEPKDFRLTGARDVVGTPHYMAPEQVEKPQEVDHRADIYSLGVVFYEMLTGELPLGKFQPPSSCARGLQIDVRLDEVVLHALEKAPERRYQQASQVKTAVETIAGSPNQPSKRAQSKSDKNPLASAALFLAGLSGVLGIVAFCLFPNPPAVLVWSIPTAALIGILLGISSRTNRFGKRSITIGCVNTMIWLIVALAVQFIHISSQRSQALKTAINAVTGQAEPVVWNGDKIVSRILPYPDFVSLFIRLPIAHAAATGQGVRVAVVQPAKDDKVLPWIQSVAPQAEIGNFVIEPSHAKNDQLDGGLFKSGCRIALVCDPPRWPEAALIQLVQELTARKILVVVPSDLSEDHAAIGVVNKLQAMGCLTVGRVDWQSEIMVEEGSSVRPFNRQIRTIHTDVFSTIGPPRNPAANPAATAAGVAALAMQKWPELSPAEIREKIVAGARQVWQATSLETGTWQSVSIDPITTRFLPKDEQAIFRFRVLDAAGALGVDTEIPWFLNMLNCQKAWEISKGRGAVVVMSDQGFHIKHPALIGRIVSTEHFGSMVFDDAAKDFHGTDMSRILLAVAPEARIVPVLCSGTPWQDKQSWGDNIAKSFQYAADVNADVVSASWADWFNTNQNILAAVSNVVDRGVVVSWFHYPHAYPGLLRPTFTYAAGWDTEPRLGFADRFLTDPPGFHPVEIEAGLSGTAPQAAGIAALVKSVNPKLTPKQIEALIVQNATPIGGGILIPDVWKTLVAAAPAVVFKTSAAGHTDNIDLPFVNDPQVIGEWKSVDFVANISEFNPDKLNSPEEKLVLKGLTFVENGNTSNPWWTWTKGVVMHHGDKTASRYEIREINGKSYLFFEWKSGDVTTSGMKPQYYVLMKMAPASAETWSPALAPGEKPDPDKVLKEAKELIKPAHYEESLQHFIWYHNHAAEFSTNLTSGWLINALSDWVELGRRYPKAKQALVEIRDHKDQEFHAGRGYFDLFMEVNNINGYLQCPDDTCALFKFIEQSDPALAGQCYIVVAGALVNQHEYARCLKYIGDGLAAFEQIRQDWEREKQWHQRMDQSLAEAYQRMGRTNLFPQRPEMSKLSDDRFVGQTCQLIEILVGTAHQTDAEKIRDEAVAVLDDARLKSAVSDAERKIQKSDTAQTLAEQPPVVVETWPVSGARDVEPGVVEIRVRFSKEMADGGWSWSTAWENSAPENIGDPHYEAGHRTCVLQVKLEPGRTYAWWLNSEKFRNFTDQAGRPAVPYLLIFQTKQN